MLPEQNLWTAVIHTAIEDSLGAVHGANNPVQARRFQQDAQAWLESDSDEPCSFNWVAMSLGFDPDEILAERLRLNNGGNLPFHLRLRIFRHHNRLTQPALGRMLGISGSTLSCIECGKHHKALKPEKYTRIKTMAEKIMAENTATKARRHEGARR